MKFRRRASLPRASFEVTAYASVFFLMVMMLMFGSRLYTPGVRINPPVAGNLPGTDRPTVTVAMDESGRYYFDDQIIGETALKKRLAHAAESSTSPLTLVIHADKASRQENLVRLTLLARDAGIHDALLATLPRAVAAPAGP